MLHFKSVHKLNTFQ